MYIGGAGGIIEVARSILDDTVETYLWSNSELIFYLNEAFNELAADTLLITDQTTTAVTQIKVLSNVGEYDLDDRVLAVKYARLNSDTSYGTLIKLSEDKLEQLVVDWRSDTDTPRYFAPSSSMGHLRIWPKFDDTSEVVGASNVSFSVNTITKTGETFSDHFAVDDAINVSGTTLNNSYLTVATVGTTTMTVDETLVTEASQSATIRKVEDTLMMTVNRMPLTPFTISDCASTSTTTPEIKSLYHGGLLDGMLKRAFLKAGTQTYDPQQAERHREIFEGFKQKVRRDIGRLGMPESPRMRRVSMAPRFR